MILKFESIKFQNLDYTMELDSVVKTEHKLVNSIIIPQIHGFTVEEFWYWNSYKDLNEAYTSETSKCLRIKYDNRIETHYFESSEKCDAFVKELEKCIKEVWSNPNMFIRKVWKWKKLDQQDLYQKVI